MVDKDTDIIKIDEELCTGCRRCAEVCPVDAIEGKQGTPQFINVEKCVMCGQCIQICSAYASIFEEYRTSREDKLRERKMPVTLEEPIFAAYNIGDLPKVKKALTNTEAFTMVQCAPAVRVAIAEEFGMPLGSLAPGKLAAALRQLGFKRIYDTNFAADLTIMEEGSELVQRITEGGPLPMFTSCCPAWVKFVEQEYPELIPHLSSCKSPQQMAGTMFKTYGAQVDGIEPESIYSVAIMPCTCKKFESQRPEMNTDGYQNVDAVLTTRELAYLIKEAGIDFSSLPEEDFDKPLGMYSGAGHLFCATGGVMEAAIRTAYELITNEPIPNVNIQYVRGSQGVRRGVVHAGDVKVKTVVVSGLKNVAPILEEIKKGNADFHFMEVMTCPVGCVSGGGQPKVLLPKDTEIAYKNRISSTYRHDEEQTYRKSHENPEIKAIYKNFLGEPLGHKSHHLLHTEYKQRGYCK
ncbi:[FeFe] hydrogenase, group A [Pelosinus sp. UFO1]|uniref:[FeFe] hydrogenase, group A n=1 Tax=Pelosinus sp. UFO1 TaxID=484770 RepID=UPI0004D1B716|nr:[FeFe] hydrogenase, group A [Pelosinus sp. UFO1]AIF51374.1 hydrogenase, Fe-only [Pelosinus sp. UFO1]